MTWPLRICFSAVLAAHSVAATVSGSVRLVDSRDSNVRRKSDYSGVVVWLEPLGAAPAAWQGRPGTNGQKKKRVWARLGARPWGSTVRFPHTAPIFCHAVSDFSAAPSD